MEAHVLNFFIKHEQFWLIFIITFLISYIILFFKNEIIFYTRLFLDKIKNIIYSQSKLRQPIQSQQLDQLIIKNLNINEAQDLLNFLDELIKRKFNFYLINEILPYYHAGKSIDKNELKQLQEKFFIDISATINKDTKKLFKKYFTTAGIELYINERFLYYINKFDMNLAEDKFNPADVI
jgi:hypothetical protein